MKMSMQLGMGQQLTMTPQLQQAIRLLQLSTLDLQQEIRQALETNPMLELDEDEGEVERGDEGGDEGGGEPAGGDDPAGRDEEDELNGHDAAWEERIPSVLSVDSEWEDIYPVSTAAAPPPDPEAADFESRDAAAETLGDHLLWQLNLTPMSRRDEAIAVALIDAIDANGQLTMDIESIRSGFDPAMEVEADEMEAVLHRIQRFDPVGVGYRNLAECLLIQLAHLEDPDDPDAVRNARRVIRDHLDLLGCRDYAQLMRRTRLKEPELKAAIAVIERLDPRPGAGIAPSAAAYVVPDVIVSKRQDTGQWTVRLNPDTAPKVRINDQYAALVRRADDSPDNNYLRNNLQEARWFIKSLRSRSETMLKVAARIVERQRDFLERGEEAMKPLVLHDIAEAVGMHESTISRVTKQKYMHTPRGIFELKYFFSSHVSTAEGGERSSTAVRAIIKKTIAAENAGKPLSDSKIAKLLESMGIVISRRTIAKYRESLSIPPSNERKRLAG